MNKAELLETIDPLDAMLGADDDVGGWDNVFSVDVSESYFSDEGAFEAATVDVLIDVSRRSSGLHCSNAKWLTFEQVQALLPLAPRKPPATEDKSEKEKCKVVEPEPWMTDPFMWDYAKNGWDVGSTDVKQTDIKKSGVDRDPDFTDSDDDLEGLDDAAIMEKLWEKRASMCDEGDEKHEAFHWWIRGGVSTFKRKGVHYDCYAAKASNRLSENWCLHYGLKRSSSYSIELYGEEWCLRMAQLWVARHSFYYRLFEANGSVLTFRYTRADIDAFAEDADIALHLPTADAVVQRRVAHLRALGPRIG